MKRQKKAFDSEYLSELGLDEEEMALLEEFLQEEEESSGADGVEELIESFQEEDSEYDDSEDLDFVLAYATFVMRKKGIDEAADKELDLDISLDELLEEEDLDTHLVDTFLTEDWEDEK